MLSRFRRLLSAAPRTLSSTESYALWSASYPPRAHNRLMEIEQAAMLALLPDLAGQQVLDLACGTGRYALIAIQQGARSVTGTDNSLPMLRAGARAGVHAAFSEASMTRLPFASRSFEVVLCGLALGHLPNESMVTALREISRVLRRGGEALISDFHPFLYLNGGRRTFTAGGSTYAVEHYPHLVADYFAAITSAGMQVTALLEPRADLRGVTLPAVLVIRCRVE